MAAEQGQSPRSPRKPPPEEYRFKPGQSGNPSGRSPSAGATIREWINSLAQRGLSEQGIRRVARDKKAPWPKRAAAERILRALEHGDLADFQGFLQGEVDLVGLRKQGINTEVLKKVKVRNRVVPVGDGETEQHVEREVELHDRSGNDFDRILDRTEGKPKQSMEHSGELALPPVVVRVDGVEAQD